MSSSPFVLTSNVFNTLDYKILNEGLTIDTANKLYLSLGGGTVGYLNILGTLSIAGSPINLSLITGITPGIALASKALILDASRNINNINTLTTTGDITTTTLLKVNRTASGQTLNLTSGTSTCVMYQFLNADCYFGTSTANNLILQTSSTARMTINGTTGAITGISSLTATTLTGLLSTPNQTNITGISTAANLDIASLKFAGITLDQSLYTGITTGGAVASKAMVLSATLDYTGVNSFNVNTLNASVLSSGLACDFGSYKIGGVSFDPSYLSGITPGIGIASKSIVLDSLKNIIGINDLTITGVLSVGSMTMASLTLSGSLTAAQVNVGSFGVNLNTNPINWLYWSANYISGGGLDFNCFTGFTSGENSFRIRTGHYSSYNTWILKMSTQSGDTTNFGFFANNASTTTPVSLWFGGTPTQITNRTTIGALPHMWLDPAGVLCVGKTSAISSSTWLEVSGSALISDVGSVDLVLSARPNLYVFDSAQITGLLPFISYGRDQLTSLADYRFASYYSGSASRSTNYTLWQSNGSSGGMTMSGFSSVKITGRNGGAYTAPSLGALAVIGSESTAVPAGWSLTPTGTASISGATVPVCIYSSGNIWVVGNVYTTSDERLKENIVDIELEEAKKLLDARIIRYNLKSERNNIFKQVGHSAQDLVKCGLGHILEIVPNEDEEFEDGFQYVVNYRKIHSMHLVLIKDLYSRIKELEKKTATILSYGDLEKHIRKTIKDVNNETQIDNSTQTDELEPKVKRSYIKRVVKDD